MAEEKERVWNDLELYIIENLKEKAMYDDGNFLTRVDILKRLRQGQYIPVDEMKAGGTNTTRFQNYIELLRREGLDIGKGDAEYGYKMPLPERSASYRELIIFRRSKK